jgi:hypothetical protein
MKRNIGTLALLCLLGLPALGSAQEHYNEGPVWRVNYLAVKPGKFNEALRDIRQNFAKVSAAAKEQGLILDYKVYLNATSNNPDDWDIATAVLYKGYAALDGLAGKMDPITLKHYSTAEARTQAATKRTELWTTVTSALAREIAMKP